MKYYCLVSRYNERLKGELMFKVKIKIECGENNLGIGLESRVGNFMRSLKSSGRENFFIWEFKKIIFVRN